MSISRSSAPREATSSRAFCHQQGQSGIQPAGNADDRPLQAGVGKAFGQTRRLNGEDLPATFLPGTFIPGDKGSRIIDPVHLPGGKRRQDALHRPKGGAHGGGVVVKAAVFTPLRGKPE